MKKVTALHATQASKVHSAAPGKSSSRAASVAAAGNHAPHSKADADAAKKKAAEEAAQNDQKHHQAQVAAADADQDMGSTSDASLSTMLQSAAAADAPAAEGDGDKRGGHISPILIVAGVAAVGGGIAAAVTTGGSSTTTPTPTPTPTPVNAAPVFAAATVTPTVAEDAVLTGTSVATDANNDALTYSLGTASKNGTTVVNANGSYTYTPTKDFNGTDSFTVSVSDGKGGTATQTVNVTITAVNDAPVFATTTVAQTVTEDVTFSGKATATDVDTGDKLTYSVGTAATKGTATVNADGTYTYLTNKDSNAADSFTIKVTDSAGASTIQTVNITVTPVNDAPTFATATVSQQVTEDVLFSGKATATDVDAGDKLTYSLGTGASQGTAVVSADGSYTYLTKQDSNAADSFTIKVTDSAGLSTTQTINIGVTPVNDAPTFAAATVALTGTEEVAIKGTAVATDVDAGDKLTYTLGTSNVKNATVTVAADGTYTYTPLQDFNGADSFTIIAKDSAGLTATQTINVTLAAVGETASIDVGTALAPVTLSAANDTRGVADNFLFTDNSTKDTNVILTNFTKGDQVQVTGASSQYSFTTVGTDVRISFNNLATGAVNNIVVQGVVTNPAILVTNEATAEQAVGFDFFSALGTLTTTTSSLDVDNDGNLATRFTVATTAGADVLTENASTANTVLVTGFNPAQDIILVSNSPTTAYSFSSVGSDVLITLNNAGVISDIRLAGVVPGTFTGLINSEASAETALGANFFQAGTATPPVTPPATSTVSLDVGTVGARTALSGATGNVTFTDNAAVGTNVAISNFTSGDLVTVTGATAANYSFTSGNFDGGTTGNDLEITFNNTATGAVNSIQILNVIGNPSAFVNNLTTATAAVGFNFITFG